MNLKEIVKHKLFKGSIVVLVGTTIGNFLNYLYHLVTGRLLSPADYGLLQSLISLTYFQSILVGAYSIAVVEKISSLKKEEVASTVKGLEKNGFKLSIAFWAVTLLFYPLIKKILHLDSFQLFFIFSLQSLFAFLPAVYNSVLQGRLKFSAGMAVSVFTTLIKLLSAVVLILLGLRVVGGLSSWVIWRIISLGLGYFLVRNFWSFNRQPATKGLEISFLKYSFLSLITNLCLTSLYTMDIILVRYYFEEFNVGIYSATSNLGKMIFFASTTILPVSFPMFVKNRVNKRKLKQMFKLSFIFCLICIFGGIAVFNLFPNFMIKLLYGSKYLSANQYLGRFSVFIGLTALFNLLIRFLLSLRSKFSGYISLFIAVGQVVLIGLRHNDLFEVIDNSIIMLTAGVIIGLFITVKYFAHEPKKTLKF